MEKKSGFKSVSKFLMGSPHKIRPVADIVRRRSYPEAILLLDNMPQKGARYIQKTVKSAAASALENNKKLDEDMLYIREIYVDDGPRLKRIWLRGRGQADRLLKRMCHITVVIDEVKKASEKPSKKADK
ncbi:MAG: 50S ribosomal protein L22 [Treponema sp.]|nr:50S ribosomal protein L22 [Treponema sp.]